MKTHRFLIAGLLLAPAISLAQSEGVATFKLVPHAERGAASGAGVQGTSKISFSKAGVRMDMQMDLAGIASGRKGGGDGDFTMTTITRIAEPEKVYMLNDRQKTYSVMDGSKDRAPIRTDTTWTVQRTGHDTVAGVGCEKAIVRSSKGSSIDVCIAPDLITSTSWWAAMYRRQDGSDHWLRAVAEAGLKGFPVRMKFQSTEGRADMEMELVNLERRGVPASLFEVPAGYKETSVGALALSPEQQKMMNDALARMTPEQRKAYEDAMKKAQHN